MISLNKVTSATINKGEDPSGLGRWTFMTLFGKKNSRTTIFNMYRQFDSPIYSVGEATVIKQQWLLLQEQRKDIHPHNAAIIDIIEAIKKKQKEGHEVLIALDGNEKFIQYKGGIARLCHECKLHDPFTHLHGKECKTNSQI